MISATILTLIVIPIFIIYGFTQRKKNLPPGPRGLPLIGNILQMSGKVHLNFVKWSKEYGSIYSLKFLSTQVVVVSEPKLLKEVFQNESDFTGRMDASAFDLYEDGYPHGIINSDGEHWEQLRRFTLRQLRDFGFGKSSMENCIMDEVNELLENIRLQNGIPFSDLKSKLTLAVVNALWTIISGKRYHQNDPKLQRLTASLNATTQSFAEGAGFICVFFPWIRKVIPKLSGYNKIREVLNEFRGFCSEAVEDHKIDYDDNFVRDFIDGFLKQIKQTDDSSSAFYGQLGEKHLVGSIGDLFAAGYDTTSITLTWAALYLSTFLSVQKTLQQEIQAITGNSRPCSLTDRPNMPYAEAVIAEVMRKSSILQGAAPHRALVDKEVRGYTITKDTLVIPALYYIHHNPEIWGDPENFRPERFLSPDGKKCEKHEALMPFSIGRRQCLGESLARDTLFLFLTNMFQKFNVKFDPMQPKPDLEPKIGVVLNAKEFDVIMEYRLD